MSEDNHTPEKRHLDLEHVTYAHDPLIDSENSFGRGYIAVHGTHLIWVQTVRFAGFENDAHYFDSPEGAREYFSEICDSWSGQADVGDGIDDPERLAQIGYFQTAMGTLLDDLIWERRETRLALGLDEPDEDDDEEDEGDDDDVPDDDPARIGGLARELSR